MFEYLNWQKDPYLIDPEPFEQNKWLTANDLVTQGNENLIFSPITQLNLYSLMLRKIDFLSGERLLQSFPYILLDDEWCILLRKQTLTLAERAYHYFQGALTNNSIRIWQKKLIQYLEEQNRLPFPLFRLADSWQDYFLEKQFVQFQSARGEDFQLPLYLTEELAYLTGVIIGDGHLADYFINIIDSSKEHIKNLAELLQLHFNSKIEFFEQQNAQAWNVNILGKWIVRFFNFLSGQPINERKYPHLCEPLIFQEQDLFRRAFWRGLMDADGSYKTTIGFGSASEQLIIDFSQFLEEHTIQHRFYEQEVCGGKTYSVNIVGTSRKDFATIIGSAHPKKQKELQILLNRKVIRFSRRLYTLEKHDTWNGQIVNFNFKKIITGYFDFSLLPDLQIKDLGKEIMYLRKKFKHKQKQISTNLSITSSLLSKYELDKTAIPINLLLKLLSFYAVSMYTFLSNYKQLVFQSSKTTCQFPTQPTDTLLTLLQGLQLKEGNYFAIVGLPNYTIEEYKDLLSDYFRIPKPQKRIFYNTCLSKLLHEFCLLRN
ncbi:MAG TPA: LAGLIDADG family homing endonuclease [Candidatus Bathyarchaeia archaeon]|nr:LAGLIDADG family homing endonuclease [Candidatus Bathyarchaeia archaeon]